MVNYAENHSVVLKVTFKEVIIVNQNFLKQKEIFYFGTASKIGKRLSSFVSVD